MKSFGTYASEYKTELLPDYDDLLFNLVGSTECFIILLLSAPVGRLLDANHSRALIIAGTCLLGAGSFLLSLVDCDGGKGNSCYGIIWLTQGLINGLGMGCFFVTSSQGEFPRD